MAEKTPTTRRVRDLYRGATGWRWDDTGHETDLSGLRANLEDEFDRWLADVRAAAWDEGVARAETRGAEAAFDENPYRREQA